MEIFIIFAIILLIVVGFGVQRLKHIQSLSEPFADFGSGRATPRERSPHERRHISKKQLRRDNRAQRRFDRQVRRQPIIPQTVIQEVPAFSYNSGNYYYNQLNRYQAPQYVPSLSPQCSDYAADRCTNVVPYSGCWNRVYNQCVDGAPTTCADYVADQCAGSTDFQSCFNFYNRVACPTVY